VVLARQARLFLESLLDLLGTRLQGGDVREDGAEGVDVGGGGVQGGGYFAFLSLLLRAAVMPM
jgi:hypothetical protein